LLHNKEELIEDELFFNAYFDGYGLEGYHGHFEYDAKEKYKDDDGSFPKLNQKADLFRK
jgi:hypothetical protein